VIIAARIINELHAVGRGGKKLPGGKLPALPPIKILFKVVVGMTPPWNPLPVPAAPPIGLRLLVKATVVTLSSHITAPSWNAVLWSIVTSLIPPT